MERRKRAKHSHLDSSHFFVLVAVETLGVMGPDAGHLFRDLGRRIATATSGSLSHQYLMQHVAVAVQRGNAASVLGTAVLLLGMSSSSRGVDCLLLLLLLHRCQTSYLPKWDRSAEKGGHWLKKAEQKICLLRSQYSLKLQSLLTCTQCTRWPR